MCSLCGVDVLLRSRTLSIGENHTGSANFEIPLAFDLEDAINIIFLIVWSDCVPLHHEWIYERLTLHGCCELKIGHWVIVSLLLQLRKICTLDHRDLEGLSLTRAFYHLLEIDLCVSEQKFRLRCVELQTELISEHVVHESVDIIFYSIVKSALLRQHLGRLLEDWNLLISGRWRQRVSE